MTVGAALFWLGSVLLGMSERTVLAQMIRRRGRDVTEGA